MSPLRVSIYDSFTAPMILASYFCDTEDGVDERRAFKALNDPDVDAIVYWDWDDFPLVGWSTYWGYKTDHSWPPDVR